MKFDFRFFLDSFVLIWQAFPLTLEITISSFFIGLAIALIFALVKNYEIKILEQILDVILSVLRGTPAILQIYIIYYALPYLIQAIVQKFGGDFEPSSIPTVFLVILALAINRAAYLSATISSGLAAVNRGEVEAAYSIGMTQLQVLKMIILPQTIKVSVPNFSTNLINLLHGSSLAFYATLLEIMGTANILAQDNWKYFETFLAAGFIYWILTIAIEVTTHMIENHLHRYEKN